MCVLSWAATSHAMYRLSSQHSAFESWIGVDNGVTRQRAATADMDDQGDAPIVHKCQTCGKTYQTIEDLSTHIVLRHPGEPVPLPVGSGVASRKVCKSECLVLCVCWKLFSPYCLCSFRCCVCVACGKWYELDRDLELHIQKRHSPDADASVSRQASNPLGLSGGGPAPPLGSHSTVSAFDLPDVAGFSTVEAKACRVCKRFFENEAKLAEHTAQEHAGVAGGGDAAPAAAEPDSQYGKLSVSSERSAIRLFFCYSCTWPLLTCYFTCALTSLYQNRPMLLLRHLRLPPPQTTMIGVKLAIFWTTWKIWTICNNKTSTSLSATSRAALPWLVRCHSAIWCE